MWLLAQILVYLTLAFLIGAAGGWMLRSRRAEEAQLHLRERFKQMVSSIEMERDAARLKARDLGARLDALTGSGSVPEGDPTTRVAEPVASEPEPTAPSDGPSVAEVENPSQAGETSAVWLGGPETSPVAEGSPPPEPARDDVQGSVPGEPVSPEPVEPSVAVPVEDLVPESAPETDVLPEVDSSLEGDVSPEVDSSTDSGEGMDAEPIEARDPEPDDGSRAAAPEPGSSRSGNRWELVEETGASEVDPSPGQEPVAAGGMSAQELVAEHGPPTPEPVEAEDPSGPEGAAPDPPRDPIPHPLTHLGEVPPEASQRLRGMGLGDTSALHGYFAAGADPTELAVSIGVEPRRVRRWRTLAELLELPNVEAPHAWLLEIAGVVSLDELSAEDPAELAQRMNHLNRDQALGLPVPERERVAEWVAEAGRRQRHG